MELERRSSGVAKAGLTTGIIGTSLATLGILGGGASVLNGLNGFGRNAGGDTVVVPVPMNNGCGWGSGWGRSGYGNDSCCSEDHYVNRYEMELQKQIAEKDSMIALRDANTYQDQKMLEMYKYVDGRFQEFERALAEQAVTNQATKDSFQLAKQDLDCCCNELRERICNEARERRCADNTIISYTNATFYPKQVADVTTGTTTTPQSTYNPLPTESCNCGR